MSQYDIFISYRRDGGEQSAKTIYDRLKDQGYKVFLDIETLRSGAFNEKLYSVIDECKDVILILSPNALDRCQNEEDWVRLEIAHALKSGKNVIPVMLRGFSFPTDLPEDVESIQYQNGIQASVEFFDAFLIKLYQFLKCKPVLRRRLYHNLSWRRSIIAICCCLLVVLGIWGATVIVNQKGIGTSRYPVTKEEKNDVNHLLYYVEINLSILDNMYQTMEDSLMACEAYLNKGNPDEYSILVSQLNETTKNLSEQSELNIPLSQELLKNLEDTEINAGDLTALANYPNMLKSQFDDTLQALEFIMNPDNPLDDVSRNKVVTIHQELNQLDADMMFVGVNDLLLPVDDEALEDFRLRYLPTLYIISNRLNQWSRDEINLTSQEEAIYTQQEKLINEYAQIVGNTNKDFMSEKEAMVKMIVAQGLSEDEAQDYVDSMLGKSEAIRNSKEDLETLNSELEIEKEKLRVKFAPLETDDPYLVWSKALRFLSVGMNAESISAFQFHLMQMKDVDENSLIYVPAAIRFVEQIGKTGIDYGVMVIGYEPDKAPHEVYQIGDIVIAVNNLPVQNFTQFEATKSEVQSGEGYSVTLLRQDEGGQLQFVDVTIPSGQPLVAFINMVEE